MIQVSDPMKQLNDVLAQRANFMRFNPWKIVCGGMEPPKEVYEASWVFRWIRSDSMTPGVGGTSQFFVWGAVLKAQTGWASRPGKFARESTTFSDIAYSASILNWSRCQEVVVVPLRRTLKEWPWVEKGREGESDTDECFAETLIGLLEFGVHSIRWEEFRDRHWNYPAI